MTPKTLTLDFSHIYNVKKLYLALDALFGFPDFYGHNADATIDCLGSLPFPLEQMSAVHLASSQHLLLQTIGLTTAPATVKQVFLDIIETVHQRWEEMDVDNKIYLTLIPSTPQKP